MECSIPLRLDKSRSEHFQPEKPTLGPSFPFCLEVIMLRWALGFFVVALIAAVLGFGGIAATAADIAQLIFYVFLILFSVSPLAHFLRESRL